MNVRFCFLKSESGAFLYSNSYLQSVHVSYSLVRTFVRLVVRCCLCVVVPVVVVATSTTSISTKQPRRSTASVMAFGRRDACRTYVENCTINVGCNARAAALFPVVYGLLQPI